MINYTLREASALLPPPPLEGINQAIFKNALHLRYSGFTHKDALQGLLKWRDTHQFRRDVENLEIQRAVEAVYKLLPDSCFYSNKPSSTGSAKKQHAPKWPPSDQNHRAQVIDSNYTLADLRKSSPTNVEALTTREILNGLFPNDPLLCCGWSNNCFDTKRISEWVALEKMQLIVPSPMTKPMGRIVGSDRHSAHTLDNTGPRHFLVLDYDDNAGADIHSAVSVYLAQKYPLALVLHSGGKSLHAWYFVLGVPDWELIKFMQTACVLGADPALWGRSQFCRMPGGVRRDPNPEKNRAKHTVHYFNPGVIV